MNTKLCLLLASTFMLFTACKNDPVSFSASSMDVTSLAVRKYLGEYELYAGTKDAGIYKTSDYSAWQKVNSGLNEMKINALAVDTNQAIYAGTDVGVYKSNDGVVWTFADSIPNVNALYASPDNMYFAGTAGYGVHKSTNGTDFTSAGAGLSNNAQSIQCITKLGKQYYLASGQGGIYGSGDGSFWYSAAWNIPLTDSLFIPILSIGGNFPHFIYAGTESDGIYRLLGNLWQADNEGLTASNISSIYSHDDDFVYISGTEGIFRKTVLDSPWVSVNAGLDNMDVTSLAGTADRIFAGTAGSGVYKSLDGENWFLIE